MVESAIRSVRKMTHADWMRSRAIRFSYRPASFGGKIFWVALKKNKSDSGMFYRIFIETNYKKKLNLLNDNYKQKTRWIDAKNDEEITKNKQVNLTR